MKPFAALLLAASTALTISTPVIADMFPSASGYTFPGEPAGTTDAVRQQAGQRVLMAPDRLVAHRAPLGTTDAVRQQAGRRVLMTSGRLIAHYTPPGTTDAVRQQAGRKIYGRYPGQQSRLLAAHGGYYNP